MKETQRKIEGLAELAKNQKVFGPMSAALVAEHDGKYALFSKGKFISVVESREEGTVRGYAECDGVFSLHEIGTKLAEQRRLGSAVPCSLKELEEEGLL